MLLRFQLRHPEHEAEHVELVAARQTGEIRHGLGNEGSSLVRPALFGWLKGFRTPAPALMRARPPAVCLGQKEYPISRIMDKYPL